jgi:hypothetical protein
MVYNWQTQEYEPDEEVDPQQAPPSSNPPSSSPPTSLESFFGDLVTPTSLMTCQMRLRGRGGVLQEQMVLIEDPHQWLQHMCDDACAKGALRWVQMQESAGSNIALLVMHAGCPETCSIVVRSLTTYLRAPWQWRQTRLDGAEGMPGQGRKGLEAHSSIVGSVGNSPSDGGWVPAVHCWGRWGSRTGRRGVAGGGGVDQTKSQRMPCVRQSQLPQQTLKLSGKACVSSPSHGS